MCNSIILTTVWLIICIVDIILYSFYIVDCWFLASCCSSLFGLFYYSFSVISKLMLVVVLPLVFIFVFVSVIIFVFCYLPPPSICICIHICIILLLLLLNIKYESLLVLKYFPYHCLDPHPKDNYHTPPHSCQMLLYY